MKPNNNQPDYSKQIEKLNSMMTILQKKVIMMDKQINTINHELISISNNIKMLKQ